MVYSRILQTNSKLHHNAQREQSRPETCRIARASRYLDRVWRRVLITACFALPVSPLLSQQPSVTISSTGVEQGGSVIISSSTPAVFQLNGVGSLTSRTNNSVTYTAPAHVSSGHVLNGCMMLPSDTVFNTPVATLPISPQSPSELSYLGSNGISVLFQWGTNVVTNATPTVPQYFYYTPSLNGTSFPIPALVDMKREEGAFTRDGNNDHHLFIVNRSSCAFFETYQQFAADPSCVGCTAQSGWAYSATSYAAPLHGTTDAAGLPLGPLTLHLAELESGMIKHALRFTACAGCVSSQNIWPANGSTGGQPGAPPMGSRLRLKATFDVSTFPPAAQAVLDALKQYGMFLADIGTTGQISASSDVTEDPVTVRQLATISDANITAADFDIVDETSLILANDSYVVNTDNPYVTPSNQAMVTVSNTSGSVQVPLALIPVTVGTIDPTLSVQAGTPTFQIPAWVNGTSDTSLTWSIYPVTGAGSIDSNGNYTAPSSIEGPSSATITATSVADPTASVSVKVTVIPAGTIHIDSGSSQPTMSSDGMTWLADGGFETGSYATIWDGYPAGVWGDIADVIQFESYMYNWGDDLEYRMHVPNGNYQVTFLFGVGECTGTFGTTSFDNGLINGPLHFQAQEDLVLESYDPGLQINHACRTPAFVTIPATVSNTSLRLAIRATGSTGSHSVPVINGLEIAPYQGNSYLTIIADRQASTILPGSSLQLHAVNWFGPSNQTLHWGVVSGPGKVDETGLYVAPSSVDADTPVTVAVQAQSGTQEGTYSLSIKASVPTLDQPLVVSPSELQFGTQNIGSAISKAVTITNPNNSSISLPEFAVQGSSSFSITKNSCPGDLAADSSCSVTITFAPLTANVESAELLSTGSMPSSNLPLQLTGAGAEQTIPGYEFVPIAPCRVVDTRNAGGIFGGPALLAGQEREFPLPESACGIPANAAAYSINATVVPVAMLGFLTLWPSGVARPNVSTLNSWDGRVKANAAIVAAGSNGAISVFATDNTNFILDINGYFLPGGSPGGLDFYPIQPCRAIDTRASGSLLQGPFASGETRVLELMNGDCELPMNAEAYSLNVTAIPKGTLGFITAWAAGSPRPTASILNSYTGTVVANAAIVPAGVDGNIALYASDRTDIVIDVNGYFAAHAGNGLSFFPITPCRVSDSRQTASPTYAGEKTVSVAAEPCSVPASAQAYIFNATAIPQARLGYLTLWPDGSGMPNVSTLNSYDGAITSNMAITSSNNGGIDTFLSDPSTLILDLLGYFSPAQS